MNQAYYALATMQAFFSNRIDNRKDRGATAVEYGLMVGLIAVVIIVAVVFLGDVVKAVFTDASTTMNEKSGAGVATPAGLSK